VDHLQYLFLMAGCVLATLPLELVFGARVWRRPRRLLTVLAAPVVIFCAWDVAAIAHHQWRYAARYVTGVDLPGHLPIEEVVFFVVVPVCAILTFEVVTRMLGPDRHLPVVQRLVPGLGRRRRR
jgi:lycopene cyclase domain-containing protein